MLNQAFSSLSSLKSMETTESHVVSCFVLVMKFIFSIFKTNLQSCREVHNDLLLVANPSSLFSTKLFSHLAVPFPKSLTNRKQSRAQNRALGDTFSNHVETRSAVLDMHTLRWICKVILNQYSSLH